MTSRSSRCPIQLAGPGSGGREDLHHPDRVRRGDQPLVEPGFHRRHRQRQRRVDPVAVGRSRRIRSRTCTPVRGRSVAEHRPVRGGGADHRIRSRYGRGRWTARRFRSGPGRLRERPPRRRGTGTQQPSTGMDRGPGNCRWLTVRTAWTLTPYRRAIAGHGLATADDVRAGGLPDRPGRPRPARRVGPASGRAGSRPRARAGWPAAPCRSPADSERRRPRRCRRGGRRAPPAGAGRSRCPGRARRHRVERGQDQQLPRFDDAGRGAGCWRPARPGSTSRCEPLDRAHRCRRPGPGRTAPERRWCRTGCSPRMPRPRRRARLLSVAGGTGTDRWRPACRPRSASAIPVHPGQGVRVGAVPAARSWTANRRPGPGRWSSPGRRPPRPRSAPEPRPPGRTPGTGRTRCRPGGCAGAGPPPPG